VSAVLLVPSARRTFALTFGYGRSLLQADSWEGGFGLKVTLNAVPPGSIKSIDRTSFDAFAHQTRTQGIRSGELEEFGLDTEQDILRAVTGKPEDEALGDKLSGKDTLVFNARVGVPGLPDFLARYLTEYGSHAYQKWYSDLDQLAEVRDGAILENSTANSCARSVKTIATVSGLPCLTSSSGRVSAFATAWLRTIRILTSTSRTSSRVSAIAKP